MRSIRARRGRFAFGVFALTVAFLAYRLLEPGGTGFVSPGELSDAHASILEAKNQGCEACHVGGNGDASHWLFLAVSPHGTVVQNDSCLSCHLQKLGLDAGQPHSLPVGRLRHLTQAVPASQPSSVENTLAAIAPAPHRNAKGEIACATCHHEHGGRRQNLKSMSDASCEVCHKEKFGDFEHGHPEFKAVRRSAAGIIFDHKAHEPRMPDGKLVCVRCHRSDAVGRTMSFTSFDEACAGCHDQGKLDHHGDQIRGGVQVVLQLPGMTLDKPGAWPDKSLAPGSVLTPMLQLLIAGDPDHNAIRALKSLASDAVAKGSTDDWDTDPATKTILALAIKRVAKELGLDDETGAARSNRDLLRDRIAHGSGLPAQSQAVANLFEQLGGAGDKMRVWQEHTLPQLADDLAGRLPLTTAPAAAEAMPPPAWKLPKDASPWFIDSDTISLNYRPAHADPLDRAVIELLARASRSDRQALPVNEKMSDDEFLASLRMQLLKDKFGGSCITCHSVEPQNGAFVVNWIAAGHAMHAPGYGTFNHRPHLTMFSGDLGCVKCHRGEGSDKQVSEFGLPTGPLNHNFAPHEKSDCSSCHRPNKAPDSCLTCHVYHMGG